MSWIEKTNIVSNNMNKRVALNRTGVDNLARLIATPKWTDSLLYGDVTKWLASLMYFPISTWKVFPAGIFRTLKIGEYTATGTFEKTIHCEYAPDSTADGSGYTEPFDVGSVKINEHFNSFLDYEPYTSIKVYLPYYGFIELPTVDVMDKTVKFKLGIDYSTGQAVYYICTGLDERILSTVSFNLGMQCPITSTGLADVQRNIALGVIHGVATVASAGVIAGAGLGVQTTTTVVGASQKVTHHGAHQSVYNSTVKRKNPATNRMGIYQKTHSTTDYGAYDTIQDISGRTTTRTYDHSNQIKQRMVSGCFETAGDVLSSLHFKPSSDRANNPFADRYGSKNIFVVITRPVVVETNAEYLKLYGKPWGGTEILGNLHGYTEISNIHLEGEGFAQATEQEIATLYDTLAQGFIL